MNTRKNKNNSTNDLKTPLFNKEGSINIQEIEIEGRRARLVGCEVGKYGRVSNAIDTVRFSNGEFKDYTRAELYLLEKQGKLKTL